MTSTPVNGFYTKPSVQEQDTVGGMLTESSGPRMADWLR